MTTIPCVLRITLTATITTGLIVVLAACGTSPGASESSPTPSVVASAPADVDPNLPLEDQLRTAIGQGDSELVSLVIDAGADVNTDYGDGVTALHIAVMGGHTEAVEALIAAGADLEAEAGSNFTPLMRAAEYPNGDIVTLLLEAGASTDVFSTDVYSSSPLHLAIQTDNTVALEALIAGGADLDAVDPVYGATALINAAYWDAPECAELLILAGADITHADDDGLTALGVARRSGNADTVAVLESYGAPE